MAGAVPRSRLLELMKVQCNLFSTTYNPDRLRTGNKVLRQRLRGPTLAAYYPRKTATLEDLKKVFKKLDLQVINPREDERLESIALAKLRGKGAPKKKKGKDLTKGKKKKR
ncbi:hypothetical protein EPUS_04434 [Endocarpon pusillum Z07020]|uniref:Small ribosomal subunit protein mS33 n=1 Tax=Endocarpon pusillum (strain Z07020 / HMAS-L-300199) TaxID=1263415 RepID=U1I3K5_ENDPU|nr:uncharacterized protein EPUS_04434 [Endocarpon pusillum Z07020]ERF76614.1 hypothetical protein EPUS_04434 [Endocarpon pusillum Z07020]